MISIVELMRPPLINRGATRPPYQPARGTYNRPVNPNDFTRGNLPVRKASLSQAVPSTPSAKNMTGMDLNKMRMNHNVSSTHGTKMPATAYKLMGRKAPAGTGYANVPLRRQ